MFGMKFEYLLTEVYRHMESVFFINFYIFQYFYLFFFKSIMIIIIVAIIIIMEYYF